MSILFWRKPFPPPLFDIVDTALYDVEVALLTANAEAERAASTVSMLTTKRDRLQAQLATLRNPHYAVFPPQKATDDSL